MSAIENRNRHPIEPHWPLGSRRAHSQSPVAMPMTSADDPGPGAPAQVEQGRLGIALCLVSALITMATTALLVQWALMPSETVAVADTAELPALQTAGRGPGASEGVTTSDEREGWSGR